MAENVVLLPSDKAILRGERDESDYKDYSTRKSQIRNRVKRRSRALARELQLLNDTGETEVAENLLEVILEESDSAIHFDLEARVRRMESDLNRIEQCCSEVDRLKREIEQIRDILKIAD